MLRNPRFLQTLETKDMELNLDEYGVDYKWSDYYDRDMMNDLMRNYWIVEDMVVVVEDNEDVLLNPNGEID